MKIAGLFAGIGGFEAGLRSAGHETKLLCDIDPLAKEVLKAKFQCDIAGDIRDVSIGSEIELITAGFPCQDLSQVGTGNGISGAKSGSVRHLFSILRSSRVPWVLFENVPFMLRLNGGHAMRYLVRKLEALGYNWAYRTIDSHAFGLPQRRRRVFLLASLESDPRPILFSGDKEAPKRQGIKLNGEACGFYWTEGNRGIGWAVDSVPPLKGGSSFGIVSAPAIMLPSGKVVLPHIRDGERLQGFRIDWTKPARNKEARIGDRWRLVGNAVNVRVSRWIGKRLARINEEYDGSGDQKLVLSHPWPAAAWAFEGIRAISAVSEWPVKHASLPLIEFLKYTESPLSYRATVGFTSRLVNSNLKVDRDFIAKLEKHALRMKPDS